MNIDPFQKTYQNKRTARRTEFQNQVSPSSSGGDDIEKNYLYSILKRQVLQETGYIQVDQERKPFNISFPHGPRSKRKVMYNPMAEGVSAEGISNECSKPTTSTTRVGARKKYRKRKTKSKDEFSDSEITIPRRIHFRGQARRRQNNSNTNGRGKLDSSTFLHYLTHMWSDFPEEKVKSVAYFDPLWFDLYTKENNREMVLGWIKEKGVFSKKYVLVPIVIWSHWSLLVICHLGESESNTPCILLLDSMHAIGPKRLEPLIRRLLFDMHESEGRLESMEQIKKMPLLIPKVPQQKEGEECGFYVLYYINLFLKSAPENFDMSKGYPYFMKKDWFTVEGVESFCKTLDAFPVVVSDHDDSASVDSTGSVEFLGTSSLMEELEKENEQDGAVTRNDRRGCGFCIIKLASVCLTCTSSRHRFCFGT